MRPLILPPAFVEGARQYNRGGVGGAFVNGSLSVGSGAGQVRRPTNLPPMPWDGARPGFAPAVQDWINGGRLAGAASAITAATLNQLAQFLEDFAEGMKEAAKNAWDWLNRPRVADTNVPYPGLGPNQVIDVTTSPRCVSYRIVVKGLEPYQGNWVPYEGKTQFWPNSQPAFPSGSVGQFLSSYSAREEKMGMLWGRESVHFIVELWGTTIDGIAGVNASHKQLAEGTGSLLVEPMETNKQGWVRQTTGISPLPWNTRLPARAPAAPAALPALFPQLPPIAPATPATMPPDLAESIGEAAQVPPFLWEGGVAVGQGNATEPTAPTVPSSWPAYLPPLIGALPITSAGTMPQTKPQPAPVTPGDSHFVNGVEIPGSTGRATLEAIAAEVTRIEGKTARLLRNPDPDNGPGDMIDRIADLLAVMGWLQDLLSTDVGGRKVTITAPCNKDADGNLLKVERQFPDADFLPAILDRVEFLIDATKATTAWRRPTCKVGTTANVTIRAIEIDPR